MVRAAVLYAANEPMPIKDLDQLPPRNGEVRVNIGAAGICASDHHVMKGAKRASRCLSFWAMKAQA